MIDVRFEWDMGARLSVGVMWVGCEQDAGMWMTTDAIFPHRGFVQSFRTKPPSGAILTDPNCPI